ncbi:SNF2 helicase associated domain-containing protein [Radiobacillus sp. PE A8.2]|uniref:SNF2 helicase associated domain-containing protein n=1 Tax=Radiobacillus sp. PE A8.2 TaxID=3380349 RepID=UPI00388DC4DA
MNLSINRKTIIEQCGTASFHKGQALYNSEKVSFQQYSSDGCLATVYGGETFHVVIEVGMNGKISSQCSCPTLASYPKDCQHIAAVFIAIQHNTEASSKLTDGLLSLFQEPKTRSSSHQPHFENRNVINTTFRCMSLWSDEQEYIFGIEVKIGSHIVSNIRDFLERMKEGRPIVASSDFTFDFNDHCFTREVDEIIQQLIEMIDDDKFGQSNLEIANHLLLISPSAWKKLLPLLTNVSYVEWQIEGRVISNVHVSEELLPLKFKLEETDGYQLKVTGLDKMLVLSSYHSVIYEGKVTILTHHDCKRLSELKRMLAASHTNQIPIPRNQIDLFLEKVVPGLKQLGSVHIADNLHKQFVKTPLVAKLYLDRVKDRLLAALEFHYENIVINPLEDEKPSLSHLLIRDVDKEDKILQMMDDSLFTKTESGYFMHNEELEFDFLNYVVPKIQMLTQIYTTTAVRNRVIKENIYPKIRVKVKKERTNWLEFKFEMKDIPEDQIRELLVALEEKRKYYRLRSGSLLSLESKEFTEIGRFLNNLPERSGGLENGLALPLEKSMELLDTIESNHTFITDESFRQFSEKISNPGSQVFQVPKELISVLRSYQKQGFQWMKTLADFGFGGILADDMGLGKTVQSIAYILSEVDHIRQHNLPVLVVCPSSVTYNWQREMKKFAPGLHSVVIAGSKQDRVKQQNQVSQTDVVITSYPILRRDYQWFEKQLFHTVFFDEAQAFKNPLTQTARAVKRIQSEHFFALTGTPVENSLEELWSIFHVVFPTLFGGLRDYSMLSKQTIVRRIQPFLMRRMKEDVLTELPEKRTSMKLVELVPEQKKLYAAYLAKLRHDTLKHLDKDTFRKNKIRILAGLTRLRQICCHPSLFVDSYNDRSAKFELLMEMLEEARISGRRVLIFSQFTKMLGLIGGELAYKGLPFFYLDGQTPSETRIDICERFNEGDRNIFLISMKAGGTGLNLTGADTVIFYDSWWNPAVEEQAADRAYRMGQQNDVDVIKLVAHGTIEEKMNELQEKKRHLIKEIIDPEEQASSSLTEEDIREILTLHT